jgi:hypothetical protein
VYLYFFKIIGIVRASDHQFSYLSSFMEWIVGLHLYPLPDVSVTVSVEATLSSLLEDGMECGACKSKSDQSKLLNTINSLNWEGIVGVDLEAVVSVNRLITNSVS